MLGFVPHLNLPCLRNTLYLRHFDKRSEAKSRERWRFLPPVEMTKRGALVGCSAGAGAAVGAHRPPVAMDAELLLGSVRELLVFLVQHLGHQELVPLAVEGLVAFAFAGRAAVNR